MQTKHDFYVGIKQYLMSLEDVSEVRYLIGKKEKTKDTLGINIIYKDQGYWLNLKHDPILNHITIYCIQKHGSRYHKISDMQEVDEIQHIVFEYIFNNLSTVIDKSNIKIYKGFKKVYMKLREAAREIIDISYKDNRVNFVLKVNNEKVFVSVSSLYDYTVDRMNQKGYELVHVIDEYTGVYANSNNRDNVKLCRNVFENLFNNYNV